MPIIFYIFYILQIHCTARRNLGIKSKMPSSNLPTVNDIKTAAAAGQRFTSEDVSAIAHAESELTGGGPVKGGPAGRLYCHIYHLFKQEDSHDDISDGPFTLVQTDELWCKTRRSYAQAAVTYHTGRCAGIAICWSMFSDKPAIE